MAEQASIIEPRRAMPRLILYMAMSLDGFITGPGDDKGNPAGVGGERLQEWLGDGGPEVADFDRAMPRARSCLMS